MEETKLKNFDPTLYNCSRHPKNKLYAIDLSVKADQRLLCAECIYDSTNKFEIKDVLAKTAVDGLIDSIMQLYYQEVSNENRRTLNSQVDKLFDELIDLMKVLRAKIKERIAKACKSSLNSEAIQQMENLQSNLMEKLNMLAKQPSMLKEGQDIENYIKIFNFLTTFRNEAQNEKKVIMQKGANIIQAARERIIPLKKDIIRWLEHLIENPDNCYTARSERANTQPSSLSTSFHNIESETGSLKSFQTPIEKSSTDRENNSPKRLTLTTPAEKLPNYPENTPKSLRESLNVNKPERISTGTGSISEKGKISTPKGKLSIGTGRFAQKNSEHELAFGDSVDEPTFAHPDDKFAEEFEREPPEELKYPEPQEDSPQKNSEVNIQVPSPTNLRNSLTPKEEQVSPTPKDGRISLTPKGTEQNGTSSTGNQSTKNTRTSLPEPIQNFPENQPETASPKAKAIAPDDLEEKKAPDSIAKSMGTFSESYTSLSVTPLKKKVIKDVRDNYTLETLVFDVGDQTSDIADVEINLRNRDLDDNGVRSVAAKIKTLRQLAGLALDFSSCTQITDIGVCALALELSGLKMLEAISLKFNGCHKITDKSLLQFASTLNKLKKMTSVSLYFSSCDQITDEGMVQIALGVSRLMNLQTLIVDVSLCNSTHRAGITDYGIAQFAVYLTQVHSLENFTFYVSSWNVTSHPLTDQGLNDFALNVGKLQQLKNLKLDFSWCINFTDRGIQNMAKSFSKLKNLVSLKIDFSWCKALTNKGSFYFSSALPKLAGLKTLHLSFSYCNQIHDEAIRDLTANLLKLQKLTYLTLNYTWCNNITDNGLIYLAKTLPNLSELNSLSLQFNSSNLLNDQGLSELSNCLPLLKKLQNLTLYFAHCNQIGELGHNALVNRLGQLVNLQRLSLYFSSCKQLTDENIIVLTENLQKLVGLKNLMLDYTGCPKITQQSVVNLKYAMNKMEELKGAAFYFFEGDRSPRKTGRRTLTFKQSTESALQN